MEQTSDELTHLERLADELTKLGLDTQLVQRKGRTNLKAANPDTPALNERVLCYAATDSSLCFWWPWKQPIGSVDDVQEVAEKIKMVLRPVESAVTGSAHDQADSTEAM